MLFCEHLLLISTLGAASALPRASLKGEVPPHYTGAFKGYGYIDAVHVNTTTVIGCISNSGQLVSKTSKTQLCGEFWLWNWMFETFDPVTREANGIATFEDLGWQYIPKQPSTQDIFWKYNGGWTNYITRFWMLDGKITANADFQNRYNVSNFFAAKVPQGNDVVNVTTFRQSVELNWLWKPNCERGEQSGGTQWC